MAIENSLEKIFNGNSKNIEKLLEEANKEAEREYSPLLPDPVYYVEKTRIIANPGSADKEKKYLNLRVLEIRINEKGEIFAWALPYCKRTGIDEPVFEQYAPLTKIQNLKKKPEKEIKKDIAGFLISICRRYSRDINISSKEFYNKNKRLINDIYEAIKSYESPIS